MTDVALTDSQLIDRWGGPAKLADLLQYPRDGGIQRIQNWKARGIPARVRLDHPELFGPNAQLPPPADTAA